MDINLKQRGRAAIDFAADLGGTGGRLSMAVNKQVAQLDLADDLDARMVQVTAALSDSPTHRFAGQLGEWSATHHGVITADAFEEIKADLLPQFERLSQGPTQIEANPDCEIPDYWVGVDFHRTTGGWVREHQGFIHGELIHPRYVAKNYPGMIFQQRAQVLEELGNRQYQRILDMGCSSAHYTLQLAKKYPAAAITGCDLGLPMLEQAQRVANENGLTWRLIQVAAEDTGLPAGSFDLVTSYIILHELPAAANIAVFEEAFRLLEPGGTVLMSDVRPYRDLNKVEEWRANHLANNGGEPYWREAATLDLAKVATDIGFVDAKSYGLGERHHPWVTIATKPQ
jgi:2-polyprenyl-3-methyl-5-hydroxy-6-metoxy-1,4-benzoquinol methylase